jgi:hypothetical protein
MNQGTVQYTKTNTQNTKAQQLKQAFVLAGGLGERTPELSEV